MSKILSPDLTSPAQIEVRGFLVYAVIRPSSKYAHQGRASGQAMAMKLTHVDAGDEYAFHLENGNRYRREDLSFYVRTQDGKFLKLR